MRQLRPLLLAATLLVPVAAHVFMPLFRDQVWHWDHPSCTQESIR